MGLWARVPEWLMRQDAALLAESLLAEALERGECLKENIMRNDGKNLQVKWRKPSESQDSQSNNIRHVNHCLFKLSNKMDAATLRRGPKRSAPRIQSRR
mmetsp:Transcript_22175/g.67328  ORF Transcript_22175/g.67328 Transcript_22175/m.67328 type:complete len:99 (+) Transcript_22175:374-670(+)